MLSTDQKGAIAEAAVIKAVVELGIVVSRPVVECRYDLVFDLKSRLLRVQCKWARFDGKIAVRCYSTRRDATGYVRRAYDRAEVDVFGVYCPETRDCSL